MSETHLYLANLRLGPGITPLARAGLTFFDDGYIGVRTKYGNVVRHPGSYFFDRYEDAEAKLEQQRLEPKQEELRGPVRRYKKIGLAHMEIGDVKTFVNEDGGEYNRVHVAVSQFKKRRRQKGEPWWDFEIERDDEDTSLVYLRRRS